MKFFRKSAPEKTTQPAAAAPVPDTETQVSEPQEPNSEKAARQWFSDRFGTDMPEEVTQLFRHIAQSENKRKKTGEQLLSPNEQKRIQDSIRLSKTKLANVTQTLNGLQAQKEWLHKLKELNANQEKFRQAFFERNKEYNAHMKDIKELERHETFEAVQDNYHHIKAMENVLHIIRKESSAHAEELAEARNAEKESLKLAEADNKKYQEAWQNLQQMQQLLAEGYRLQTALQHYDNNLNALGEYQAHIDRLLKATRKYYKDTGEELKRNSELAAQQQQQQQNMESQKSMLIKGEAVLVKLGFLQSLKKNREQIQDTLEKTIRKQHEQDEKLNKLFLLSQDIDAQINTLQSELAVHQKSVVGMNSYNLQQRAIALKSKREMLINAMRLWEQIAEGYSRVDDKTQEIMRMRHHNDTLKSQIAVLEPETAGLQRQCEELKYAYTLSKSQDVMHLRKDLQEGVSCSVCGATHHPYHSDTLLEQSKLIGEIKRDYEQASMALKHKQTLLEELKKEQATEEGHITAGQLALTTYKQILQHNVTYWKDFVTLDRSFGECSASTNFDGRRIMLQQLVEKTGLDAENAQKELDTLNFHQSNINALNEKIAQKEQEKNEIAVRLNEVNTGSQVLAYRVEQLQQSLAIANGQYSELFENIDKMMTISNWYKAWTENPENLRVYIQQQMERWFNLQKDMELTKNETIRLQTVREMIEQLIPSLSKQRELFVSKAEQMTEHRNQTHEQLFKLFHDGNVEEYNKTSLQSLCTLEELRELSYRKVNDMHIQAANRQGYYDRLTDTARELEAQIAKERSTLDVWIRKYNAQNSPVQFAELEETFSNTTDWNALRKEIRTLTLQNMLAEARAEEARLALAAHQVNALSQGQDKEDRTAALNTEIARLEKEQNNILVQIAGYQAQLAAHENGLRKLTANQNAPAIL